MFIICQRLLQLSGIEYELRNVSLLRRRTFGSIGLADTSSENSCSGQRIRLPAEHDRKVGSDSLLVEHVCRDDEKEMTDISLDADVFYDSFADGAEDIRDMDELSPEQFLRHSVSESALSKGSKVSPDMFSDKHRSLYNIRNSILDHSSKADVESSYSEMETARFSDTEEVITIDVKKTETNLASKISVNLSQKFSDLVGKNSSHLNNNQRNDSVSALTEHSSSQLSLGSKESKGKGNLINVSVDSLFESVHPSLAAKVSYTGISTLLEKYKVKCYSC